jgi:hypothetical protein
MLRIHVEERPEGVVIRLEGKLIAPWVEELARAWTSLPKGGPGGIQVALEALSFADEGGLALLRTMGRAGCRIGGADPFIAALLEDDPSQPPSPQRIPKEVPAWPDAQDSNRKGGRP